MTDDRNGTEQNCCNGFAESDKGVSGQSEGVFFWGDISGDKSNGLQRPAEVCNKAILIGNFLNENYGTSFAGNVYDKYGLCPTLRSSEGGHKQPHVIERVGH